jgi:hypothetical protein
MKNLTAALTISAALGAGFLAGSRFVPAPLDSELATAQEIAQDRGVAFVGYLCGDDGATIITHEMPGADCKEARRLSDSAAFPAPPRSL